MSKYPSRKPKPTRKVIATPADPAPGAPKVSTDDVGYGGPHGEPPKPSPMPLPPWMPVEGQLEDPNEAYANYLSKREPTRLDPKVAAEAAGLPAMPDRPEWPEMDAAEAMAAAGLSPDPKLVVGKPLDPRQTGERAIDEPERKEPEPQHPQPTQEPRERETPEQAKGRVAAARESIADDREAQKQARQQQHQQRQEIIADANTAARAGLAEPVIIAALEASDGDKDKRRDYLDRAHKLASSGAPQDLIAEAIREDAQQGHGEAAGGVRGQGGPDVPSGPKRPGDAGVEPRAANGTDTDKVVAAINDLKPLISTLIAEIKGLRLG